MGQEVVNGRLVTEFMGELGDVGGTLVCEPVKSDDESSLSVTVTRFSILFWDKGNFTPRFN